MIVELGLSTLEKKLVKPGRFKTPEVSKYARVDKFVTDDNLLRVDISRLTDMTGLTSIPGLSNLSESTLIIRQPWQFVNPENISTLDFQIQKRQL